MKALVVIVVIHLNEIDKEKEMSQVELRIFQMEHAKGLPLPEYATAESSGLDLIAAVDEEVCIKPGFRAIIITGITLAIPSNHEVQIRPRSGLAANHGVTVLNTPGTIDADYRGEIKIVLINLGQEEFIVKRGMRIAQMVVAPVSKAMISVQAVPLDNDTTRSTGGFGSTGLYKIAGA